MRGMKMCADVGRVCRRGDTNLLSNRSAIARVTLSRTLRGEAGIQHFVRIFAGLQEDYAPRPPLFPFLTRDGTVVVGVDFVEHGLDVRRLLALQCQPLGEFYKLDGTRKVLVNGIEYHLCDGKFFAGGRCTPPSRRHAARLVRIGSHC